MSKQPPRVKLGAEMSAALIVVIVIAALLLALVIAAIRIVRSSTSDWSYSALAACAAREGPVWS